jgi:hypothetical protein
MEGRFAITGDDDARVHPYLDASGRGFQFLREKGRGNRRPIEWQGKRHDLHRDN